MHNLRIFFLQLSFITLFSRQVVSEVPVTSQYGEERSVKIIGYDGHAMEPFISRDSKFLIFNSLNDSIDTSLHYAKRLDETNFTYVGKVEGANGVPPHLDAVGSADIRGIFYWITNREYPQKYENVMRGKWENGKLRQVKRVRGDIYIRQPGWIIMDSEIAPDGKILFYANAYFTGGPIPAKSDIAVAHNRNGVFSKDINSDLLLSRVNTAALEYAPSFASDGLSLFFTRLENGKTSVLLARRKSLQVPFGSPRRLNIQGETPEAPSISLDQKLLYYHKHVDGRFQIFVMRRTR